MLQNKVRTTLCWREPDSNHRSLRRPLGITIVGGLLVAQLLTLYTTPVVYLYLDHLRLWVRRPWRIRQSQLGDEALPEPGE